MFKKINKLQIFRFVVQVMFFAFWGGIITLAFNDLKQIYIFLIKGNTDYMLLIPKIMVIIVTVLVTMVVGRFFCGWGCAFGVLNDWIYMTAKRVFKIKFKVNEKVNAILGYFRYAVLAFIVWIMWNSDSLFWDTVSPWDAFAQLPDVATSWAEYTTGSILLTIIILGAILIERFFCRYLCPLGGVFGVVSMPRLFRISKPKANCGSCKVCTNNCPMGIPLYKSDKVNSSQCISCLKCIDVCPRANAHLAGGDTKVNAAVVGGVAVSAIIGFNYLGNEYKKSEITSQSSVEMNSESKAGTPTETVAPEDAAVNDPSAELANPTDPKAVEQNPVAQKAIEQNSVDAAPNNSPANSSPASQKAAVPIVPKALTKQVVIPEPVVLPKPVTPPKTQVPIVVTSPKPVTPPAPVTPPTTVTPIVVPQKVVQTKYKDGTYTGVGRGYSPGLTAEVTIKNDKITRVQIISDNETPSYSYEPFSVIPNKIIKAQSTKVDSISGATRSSNGIKAAVENALSKALNQA